MTKRVLLALFGVLALVAPASAQTITLRGSASNANDAAGTTLATSSAIASVAVGDCVAVWAKHEVTAGTITVSNGTNNLTALTKRTHTNADLHGQWFWERSPVSGSITYTMTTVGTAEFRSIIAYVFSTTGICNFDVEALSAVGANGTSVASGSFTTTGTTEVVLAGYGNYGGGIPTAASVQINGVDDDGQVTDASDNASVWYRIVSATMTGATATGTIGVAEDYVLNVVSIKSVLPVLSGTITASTTEADLVSGGKTIILDLTGDTWQDNLATIQYVGGQDNSFAGTTSNTDVTFALNNGLAGTPAAGDLVVVTFCTGSTADRTLSITNTAGTAYTLIGSELYANDLFDVNMRVAYRFMPGTPETAVRFAGGTGNAADAGTYAIQVFRNVDTGTPMDVAATTDSNINTRLINPPSITPTTAGAWIGVSGCGAGATLTADYTSPGGSTTSDFRTDGQTDTNDSGVAAWYNATWTSGAFNPGALTGGGTDTTDDSWASVMWVLRPATDNTFDNQRDELRDGCDSAQSEGAGWDARKATILPVANVVRTDADTVTMTAAADGSFNITAQETVTCTIPAAIVNGGMAVVATPTFTIDTSGGGGAVVKDVIGGTGIIAFPR